jgi:hypothetical protein
MSYVLFSQTSAANGTRNLWNVEGHGSTGLNVGNTSANGVLTNVAAADFSMEAQATFLAGGTALGGGSDYASDGIAFRTGQWGMFDLSATSGGSGGFAATGLGSLAGAGDSLAGVQALGGGGLGTGNLRTRLDSDSGFNDGVLTIGLREMDWNQIKNVEVRINSLDTTADNDGETGLYSGLRVTDFVDARVKIGDTSYAGCTDASIFDRVETFSLDIINGKRGQIDGAQSDMALDVRIDVWTNDGGWQNSFNSLGSVFNDTFEVNYGALSSANMFGRGAGTVYTGAEVDGDDTGTQDIQTGDSVYNGAGTTLLTNMGAGRDSYDSTDGATAAGASVNEASVLQTIDWVWGGSGGDLIATGAGNDRLFGDFGAFGGISQAGDTTAPLSLRLGGTGNPEAWVAGTGVTLTAFNGGSGITTVFGQADIGNDAKAAVFDTNLIIQDRPGGPG